MATHTGNTHISTGTVMDSISDSAVDNLNRNHKYDLRKFYFTDIT